MEVKPVTKKADVANFHSNNATIIDGLTNSTTTVAAGSNPFALVVNPVTNKIYVANNSCCNGTVTVIVGATNSTTTVVTGATSLGLAVNPVTNKIYVPNFGAATVTLPDTPTHPTTPSPHTS